jgi:hypothetical protein
MVISIGLVRSMENQPLLMKKQSPSQVHQPTQKPLRGFRSSELFRYAFRTRD